MSKKVGRTRRGEEGGRSMDIPDKGLVLMLIHSQTPNAHDTT